VSGQCTQPCVNRPKSRPKFEGMGAFVRAGATGGETAIALRVLGCSAVADP
jgi:hypothetical protein